MLSFLFALIIGRAIHGQPPFVHRLELVYVGVLGLEFSISCNVYCKFHSADFVTELNDFGTFVGSGRRDHKFNRL